MKNKDSLEIEYKELMNTLQGISPQTETYQKVQARLQEIKKLIGNGVMGSFQIKKTVTKRGKYINKLIK